MRYLDPKNDLTFKKIFGQHPHLLKSFLNAVMPLAEGKKIVSLESALEFVKQYEGSSDQLGFFLKSRVLDRDLPPNIAILGIPEGRGSGCMEVSEAPDAIRRHLYTLTTFSPEINIVDLGNIKSGNELKDTHAAVKIVAEELSAMNIHLLILV